MVSSKQNPSEPHPQWCLPAGSYRRGSIAGAWLTYYVLAFFLLIYAMPVVSHSNSWTGILPGFAILMFGAYRLTKAGAHWSTSFIYGCGSAFLFLPRFFSMDRFSLWMQYRAPSDTAIVLIWCGICVFLGAYSAGITYCIRNL